MNQRLLLLFGALLMVVALAFRVASSSGKQATRQGADHSKSTNQAGATSAGPATPGAARTGTTAASVAPAVAGPALPRELDPALNPYAGALRQPGTSKRAWDATFLDQFQQVAAGASIRFELTEGVLAVGKIQLTQYRDGRLSYLSGDLSEPERGKFFFLTPPPGGKAGKAVGVVEFAASETAYRIEPTGPNGEPELWRRRLDEVVCRSMPLANPALLTNKPVNMPPLRPDSGSDYIPSYNSNIVSLQSFPGSPAVLLLDFFGGYTPTWGGVTYPRPQVSNAEIKDLWKRVAEDFIGFNINVTTDLRVYQAAPPASRQICAFTPGTASNPLGPGGAGVAYIGSWNWGSDTVCWSGYISGKAGAEVAAHEPGHTLGLGHQTEDNNGNHNEYFAGHGSGATGWAPIMGAGYYDPVTTWSKGEYQYAGNTEDELNLIVSQNNSVAYRTDDTGSTLASARYLEVYPNNTVRAEGVIERTGDTDAFQFTTTGGQVSLTANPVGDWANLAVIARLANAADAVIASNNPQTVLSATITTTLPAGTYTFRVTGTGRGSALTDGFSPYSSLGYYAVTGTVAGARLPTRLSVVEHAPNGTVVGPVPVNNPKGGALAYAIRSGNTGNTFALDAAGTVTVANNTLLDYYRLATNTMLPVQFELFVNITNLSDPVLTELNRRVVIAVLDANDAPLITGFTNTILAHSPPGMPVGMVTARDLDLGQVLSFSLDSGNSNGLFAIDQLGQVTVAGDLNDASLGVYNLAVTARDSAAQNPLVSTGFVTITVVTNSTPFRPGAITYTVYDGIGSGTLISDLTNNSRFPADPSAEKLMPSFEGDSNRGDNYGAVMRGYLIPPVSGSYTFWLATDDSGELWLSLSTNAATMTRIAYINNNWASPRQWNKLSTQQSTARTLIAGQAYYIEARMKEGSGNDNIAVGWKGPVTAGKTNVIPGQYLAPCVASYQLHATGFTTSVRRNALLGARLGRVLARQAGTDSALSFAILDGNPDGLFSVDNAGWVRVADEAALQTTPATSYTLTIGVTGAGGSALATTATAELALVETNAIVPTTIQREMFYDIGGGTAVSDLASNAKYPARPDALLALSGFASPTDVADNYGSRIRAYLTPPSSGLYRFFIASDDASVLLFSLSGNPSNVATIASVSGWADQNAWTANASQVSAAYNLTAGQRYYLETRHKEGGGGDHVEVGWAGPGLAGTNVIDAAFLTPPDLNYPPLFTNQVLQVSSTVDNHTPIGNLFAVDSPLDTLTFKILDGNTNNTFALAADSGQLTVEDNTLIADGSLSRFTLLVAVQDSGCGGLYPLRTAQATVTINVADSNSLALVWTGGGPANTWSGAGNWAGLVPGSGARLTFGYPQWQTNYNDVATLLGSVRFNAGGFNIGGQPLTLQSGLTNSSGNNTWAIDTTLGAAQTWLSAGGTLSLNGGIANGGRLLTLIANSKVQLSGPVSGTAGLTKNGTATLQMRGTHTYSGATSIAATGNSNPAWQLFGDLDLRTSDVTLSGSFDLANFNAQIGALNGTGTISAGDIPQPTLSLGANNHSGSFSGVIQDSTVGLSVSLGLVKNGTGMQTLSGNNSFTGGLVVNGGTVVLGGANGNSSAGRGTLTINRNGTVNATGDNQLGLENNGYLAALNIAGGTFNAGNYLHVNSITLNGGALGVISGVSQADGLDLRPFNNANPLITVLSNATAATISSKITLSAPAYVDVANGSAATDLLISGNIVGANPLIKTGPGTLVLGGICTYAGGTLVSSGTLQIGTGSAAGSVNGNLTNQASLVFNRSGTLSYGGVISGPGSLGKIGTGTVTFTAAHTYTGPTVINQGTLALGAGASLLNSTAIAVGGGATLNAAALAGGFVVPPTQTLTGSGTVLGNVQLNGTLAPGPMPGGLTFNADLTLNGVTVMELNKSGGIATNDWAAAAGTLTYGGALVVTNTGEPLAAGDVFPLFSAGTLAGNFSTLSLPPLGAGLRWITTQLPIDGTLRVAAPTTPLVSVSLGGAGLQLSLPSDLGATYVLETTPSLVPPIVWTPVSTNNGTGNPLSISAPIDAAQPQQLFRVAVYW